MISFKKLCCFLFNYVHPDNKGDKLRLYWNVMEYTKLLHVCLQKNNLGIQCKYKLHVWGNSLAWGLHSSWFDMLKSLLITVLHQYSFMTVLISHKSTQHMCVNNVISKNKSISRSNLMEMKFFIKSRRNFLKKLNFSIFLWLL